MFAANDSVPGISTGQSLAVIAVVLTVTTVASIIKVRKDPEARAHVGSLRDHPPGDPDAGWMIDSTDFRLPKRFR